MTSRTFPSIVHLDAGFRGPDIRVFVVLVSVFVRVLEAALGSLKFFSIEELDFQRIYARDSFQKAITAQPYGL
jgi:hypothetical protein